MLLFLTVREPKPCTKKLIENTLVNNLIFYTGKFNFDGVQYNGNHEPMISSEMYLNILKIRNEKNNPKTQKHSFIYRGLIKCEKSGRLLTGEVHKGANNSGDYIYYRCHYACKDCPKCPKYWKEESIDSIIKETLQNFTISEEKYKEIVEETRYMRDYQLKFDAAKQAQLSGQITKLKLRLNKLYDDKLDGVISEDVYFDKKKKWEVEIEEKSLEYSALNKTNGDFIDTLEKMFELLENLWGRYKTLENEKKRFLLKLLCSNFFYDGSNLVITIKEPFKALYKFSFFDNGAEYRTKFEFLDKKIKPLFETVDVITLVEAIKLFIKSLYA